MSTTVRFKLQGYNIAKEDDGWFGRGVDLYLGWIVQSQDARFAGVSDVHGGLKVGSHTFTDHFFDLAIPDNQYAIVHLYMYESDETTPQVARSFQELEIPTLHDYYLAPGQVIDFAVTSIMGGAIQAVIKAAELLRQIYSGSRLNTDDAYGRWTYILNARSSGVVEHSRPIPRFFSRTYTVVEKGVLPTVLKPRFVDAENDIEIRILASIVGFDHGIGHPIVI